MRRVRKAEIKLAYAMKVDLKPAYAKFGLRFLLGRKFRNATHTYLGDYKLIVASGVRL